MAFLVSAWRAFIARHIVIDTPRHLAACVDCIKLDCSQATFEACPARKSAVS